MGYKRYVKAHRTWDWYDTFNGGVIKVDERRYQRHVDNYSTQREIASTLLDEERYQQDREVFTEGDGLDFGYEWLVDPLP